MYFYLTLNKDGNIGFSPLPLRNEPDSPVTPVTPVTGYLSVALPYSTILLVQEQFQRQTSLNFWHKRFKQPDPEHKILKILTRFGWDTSDLKWKKYGPAPDNGQDSPKEPDTIVNGQVSPKKPRTKVNRQCLPKEPETRVKTEFDQLTLGRQLSTRDLRRLANQLRIKEDDLIRLAHINVEQGKAKWVPAVRKTGSSWQCQRCGERDVEEWPGQYGMAVTCPSCASIGSSTSLDVLYRDQRSLLSSPAKVLFQPYWALTAAQGLAAEQVLEFIKDPCEETALLWAACGAGKTEVCFPSAAWALQEGKSVLFAAPRQDVINDVAPRLKRDFPDYPIQVLTGTSSPKFQAGNMVLATTHQVLRFWRAFNVIFLDEMDAFPYQGSRALEWGLNHSLRQGGKILYLTATPSPEALKRVKQGKMRLIRLPARYHRTALPVPSWEKSPRPLEPNECTDLLASYLDSLRAQGPVLVFVPKISWLSPWIKCFRRRFPGWRVDGSYSADPGRQAKIERLRQGEFDLFVSTTILERGITLPRIQVLVLGADDPIFDERALVQMAGRTGRTRENPEGKVLFVSKQITPAIRTAIHWIEEQNKHALEQGLIDIRNS